MKIFDLLLRMLKRALPNRNLPCDSKSPKLCYACHVVRGRLTGRNVVNIMLPSVIHTMHGSYEIVPKGWLGRCIIRSSGRNVESIWA